MNCTQGPYLPTCSLCKVMVLLLIYLRHSDRPYLPHYEFYRSLSFCFFIATSPFNIYRCVMHISVVVVALTGHLTFKYYFCLLITSCNQTLCHCVHFFHFCKSNLNKIVMSCSGHFIDHSFNVLYVAVTSQRCGGLVN